MKSDLEDLFKSAKPSLAQVIGASRPLPELKPRVRKTSYLIVVLPIVSLLVVGGLTALYFRTGRTPASSGQTEPPTPPPRPAPAYFATETSRTITVKKQDRSQFLRLMEDAWKEHERQGTVKRIAVNLQDGPQERFATPADFFSLWRLAPPSGLTERLDPNLMVFIYYGASGNRMGLAARTREPERTLAQMLSWETSLVASAAPLFFDERAETVVAPFEDRTWRNIDWRYLKLSQERDLGIGYTVFPVGNVLIFTTSKEAMETVINRLFDAR